MKATLNILLGVIAGCLLTAGPAVHAAGPVDLTVLQCGNLIYAGSKSSVCFADKFLTNVKEETNLSVTKNFQAVKLGSDDLFNYPFCVFSGEDNFALLEKERENLRKYLLGGGFILSSPGCSDSAWDKALRREIKLCFPEYELKSIPMTHPVFSVVHDIPKLNTKGGKEALLEGLEINGRLVMIHSKEGLNDVGNAKGCCCCGGDMIRESIRMNINIFTYALLY